MSSLQQDTSQDKANGNNEFIEKVASPEPPTKGGRFKAADNALQFLAEHDDGVPIDEEEEKKVVRKIDWRVIPVLCVTFMLQQIDKASLGQAAVFGLPQDLDLYFLKNGVNDSTRYSLANSIFFIGYIPGTYILAFIAQKFPIAKCCAAYIFIWGVIFLLSVVCTEYRGFYVQRFMLGFFEGGVSPTFVIITGMWYKKAEQPLRSGLWYSFVGTAFLFNMPIGVGLLEASKSWGLGRWKSIFYFWGAVTILWSAVVLWVLPDSPMQAKFLNERERYVAVERLRSNQQGVKSEKFLMRQVIEGATDIKLHILFAISFGILTVNGMISSFLSIIFKGMGFSSYESLLLQMPGGFIAMVVPMVASYVSTKYKNMRTIVALISCTSAIISFVILYVVPPTNRPVRLFATLLSFSYTAVFPQALAFTSSNVSGYTKKSFAASWTFIGYCLGQIAGPMFYVAREAPVYKSGMQATLVCLVGVFVLLCLHAFLCIRENARREKLGEVAQEDRAFQELTDKENLTFRYVY